jgi:archaemetzincin
LNEHELNIIDYLVKRLEYLTNNVNILKSLPVPSSAYNPKREQYLAEEFLQFELDEPYDKLLVITDVDLYSGNLNFVFGIAEVLGKRAIISVHRLKDSDELYNDRVLKEAVHELGHTFGLKHCPNPKCVMHFSNCLKDTDIKDWRFCHRCSDLLERLSSREIS